MSIDEWMQCRNDEALITNGELIELLQMLPPAETTRLFSLDTGTTVPITRRNLSVGEKSERLYIDI